MVQFDDEPAVASIPQTVTSPTEPGVDPTTALSLLTSPPPPMLSLARPVPPCPTARLPVVHFDRRPLKCLPRRRTARR